MVQIDVQQLSSFYVPHSMQDI